MFQYKPRCKVLLLAMLPALFAVAPALAVTVADLYETSQPVETSRDAAFVEALKTVLVRVSGQRDAATRVGPALGNPRKYTQRFSFASDGSLQVGFDSGSVDQLLAEAGLPIWGRERPATLVLLYIEEPGGARLLGLDAPAAERDAVIKAARQRGLPLVWPSTGAPGGVGAVDTADALLQTAARYGANAVLVGRARRDSSNAFAASWQLVSQDGEAEAAGTLDDGVHLAADTFARVFAASGSSLGTVVVEVAGIGDLNAYATTLNYLEGMTLVRGVALEEVAADTMRFRLAVRGDAATLRRAIALDSRLTPLAPTAQPDAASDRLLFRYQH
jgi:uncharacterized protein